MRDIRKLAGLGTGLHSETFQSDVCVCFGAGVLTLSPEGIERKPGWPHQAMVPVCVLLLLEHCAASQTVDC